MAFLFPLSLNTSTLRPFRLGVLDQIRVAGEAGYQGIELWVRDIQNHLGTGGTTEEIRRAAEKAGLSIPSAIAFFKWTDADAGVRAEGMRQAAEEIALLAEIGCSAVAAPPTGDVTRVPVADLGANYARLAGVGLSAGVRPILEFWGRAAQLNCIREARAVLEASGVSDGSLLLDLFHMYTGGSSIEDVGGMQGHQVGLVHINDYPASPARESIADADRVMPGDGIGPVGELLYTLQEIGYRGFLSVELFIQDYGEATAVEVATTVREKTLSCLPDR